MGIQLRGVFVGEARKISKQERRELYKLKKETAEILMERSSKRLAGQIKDLMHPTVITTTRPDGMETISGKLSQVKTCFQEHFQSLFMKSPISAEIQGVNQSWMEP